jgi:hypothetical protein
MSEPDFSQLIPAGLLIFVLFLASCAARLRPEPTDCRAASSLTAERQAQVMGRARLDEQEYGRRHGWNP